MTIKGTKGNDTLKGTSGDDIFDLTLGGNDHASGLGGDDTFKMGGALTASDQINGGIGSDTLVLSSNNYAAGLTFGAKTIVNVETIKLNTGHDYRLTTNDGNVANDATLTVDGSALTVHDVLTFNGSHETNGAFDILAGKAADVLTGGGNADTFDLSLGGSDTAKGGAGSDVFDMGAKLNAADVIAGGTGNDTVKLNGDYSAGVTFNATTMTGVESLVLAGGHDYKLTLSDATVVAGATLEVEATALGAGDTLTFDGHLETNGSFHIAAGAGDDVLTGGAQADVFAFAANYTDADIVNGGGGSDTVTLSGSYAVGVTLGVFNSVESLSVSGITNATVTVDAGSNAVGAGETLAIDGHGLTAAQSLVVNGGSEGDGILNVIGGAGGDIINMGAHFTAANSIDGGGGVDVLNLDGDYSGANALVFTASTLMNVETISLAADHDYSITTAPTTVGDGDALTVDAGALGAANSLTFDGHAESLLGSFDVIGGAGDDTVTGGALADMLDFSHGGNDTVDGGGANDIMIFGSTYTSGDLINGGSGNDTVVLDGAYGTLTLTASSMTSVEGIELLAGHSYSVAIADSFIGSSGTITVDASLLGAGDTFTFDGSAETDGALQAIGGAGADSLIAGSASTRTDSLEGGGGNDTLDFTHTTSNFLVAAGDGGNDVIKLGGAFTSSDLIDGGKGYDKVQINGLNLTDAVAFGPHTMVNVEDIILGGGHNYSFTTGEATVDADATLTVDAHALGSGDLLIFDGHFENDGHFAFIGGAGADNLLGGAIADSFDLTLGGSDHATGGGGQDTFTIGTGTDVFVYGAATQSSSTGYDIFHGMNFTHDTFDLASGVTINAITGPVSGTVDASSFDSNVSAVLGDALGAHDAVLLTVTGGSLNGETFLVVDGNGVAGYSAGSDYVFDVTGYTGTLGTGNFT